MAASPPIPVRLNQDLIDRLDKVAARIGSNRAAVIRICIQTFVEFFEEHGVASLPPNWHELVATMDSRTKAHKAQKSANPAVHPNVLNLMPDPNLDPKVKEIADDIERLEMAKLKRKVRKRKKHT